MEVGDEKNLDFWKRYFQDLSIKYSEKSGTVITEDDVLLATYLEFCDREDVEFILDVTEVGIDPKEIEEKLDFFDFSSLNLIVEVPVTQNFKGGGRYETKFLVKARNDVWRIRKNDLDPFPSDPHAHLDGANIKMHLGNGNCYQKRKFVYRYDRKKFLDVREKASKIYKGTLPQLEL
jgi:hypothetical protein